MEQLNMRCLFMVLNSFGLPSFYVTTQFRGRKDSQKMRLMHTCSCTQAYTQRHIHACSCTHVHAHMLVHSWCSNCSSTHARTFVNMHLFSIMRVLWRQMRSGDLSLYLINLIDITCCSFVKFGTIHHISQKFKPCLADLPTDRQTYLLIQKREHTRKKSKNDRKKKKPEKREKEKKKALW